MRPFDSDPPALRRALAPRAAVWALVAVSATLLGCRDDDPRPADVFVDPDAHAPPVDAAPDGHPGDTADALTDTADVAIAADSADGADGVDITDVADDALTDVAPSLPDLVSGDAL